MPVLPLPLPVLVALVPALVVLLVAVTVRRSGGGGRRARAIHGEGLTSPGTSFARNSEFPASLASAAMPAIVVDARWWYPAAAAVTAGGRGSRCGGVRS